MDERVIKKFLGRRIKKLRKERGMTQRKASEKAGMLTENRWSDIERGMYSIGLTTLIRIAQGLEVHIQELFKFEETEEEKADKKFIKEMILKWERQVNKMCQEMTSLKKNICNFKNSVK